MIGMDAPSYSNNLELVDANGNRSDIADFVVGEPIEEKGLRCQSITLTVPVGNIRPGMKVNVIDKEDGHLIFTFLVERVTPIKGEKFATVDGRNYLTFPNRK
jgi:hypothetical protein